MDNKEINREESHFAEMLGAIESPTHEPDEAFLNKLKAESTQTFLDAGTGRLSQKRTKKMKIFRKFIPTATAACIIVGITVAVVFLTVGNGGASITWADVQQHLRKVRTMTFKMTMEMEGLPKNMSNMSMKMLLKEPGLIRTEITMGPAKNSIKSITIMDIKQSKMISLVESKEPKLKKAIIFDLREMPEEIRKKQEDQDFLAEMKKMIEESETELGEKQINGRTVKGYRVEKGKLVITIWADAKTGRPVEMNMAMFQGGTKITMSDFKFDVKLDKSLFSLDVPKGYTIEKKQLDLKPASAADVAKMLRVWVTIRGGTFPNGLTFGNFMKDMKDIKSAKKKDLELEFKKGGEQKLGQSITKAMMLFAQHSEAYYAGKGVKLGEADKAVFWYKPKNSKTYKVIYGDLSIKDVAEKDLPQKQATP